jgi:aminoglycoside phosphotransferase (APT) family kinase protein
VTDHAAGDVLGELPARVRGAAQRRWAGAGLGDLDPLPGGISSLTYATTLTAAGGADRRVVVKVAPPGLAPVRNRDVLRQARVLAALHRAPGVLVPEVLLTDQGSPPFFVMAFVPGEAYEPKWDLSDAPPAPAVVEARARAAARMLARLQAVEPAAVGIKDAPLTPIEEIERWAALFATAPEDLQVNEAALREALSARVPAAAAPRILHGDYRLGNMQFDAERLAAIIDWEIWSVGDPRIDLAWLTFFTDDAGHPAVAPGTVAGTPAGREVVRAYEDALGRGVPELGWFDALTRYKEAGVTGLLLKRAMKLGRPVKESMARMQPELPRLVQEAIRIVSG